MQLDTSGHPLHTRALTVTLAARPDAKLDVAGSILDLRKRGFVPVAGALQASGIIHHMLLRGIVDPGTGRLETIAAEQPSVAFEPSAATGGESCRDPIARIEAVAGATVGAELLQRLGTEIGGPRGCSHVLTLGRLLASTVAWALDRDRAVHGAAAGRRPGERVFRRDLVIDAAEEADGGLGFAVQLGDLHFGPVPEVAPPMDAFAGHREVRALLGVDLPTRTVTRAALAERERDLASLGDAAWRTRPDLAGRLVGLPLGAGGSAEVLRRLAGSEPPLVDALLMVAPTLVQCLAALADALPLAARASGALAGIGGLPDSCWMWRRAGALARSR